MALGDLLHKSPLYLTLQRLLGKDVPVTIGRVLQRNIDALEAIEKLSWEELSLKEMKISDFTDEQLSEITKVPTEEWKEWSSKDQAEDFAVPPKSEEKLTIEQC